MDMAFGGNGAPLTPAFHQGFLNSSLEKRIILNLGGIANITILDPINNDVTGFDTGPANCLMDLWLQDKFNLAYDDKGNIAKSGRVIQPLLKEMLEDPYFAIPAPKSTGKEIYHLEWIMQQLSKSGQQHSENADVLRTLLELTVVSVTDAIKRYAIHGADVIYACGGGAYNVFLLERIQQISGITVQTTNDLGISVDLVEAVAFAWFARERNAGRSANYESVTGASRRCQLGAIYEA